MTRPTWPSTWTSRLRVPLALALVALVAARRELLEYAGLLLLAYGVGLIYLPLAPILAGIVLVLVANRPEGGR
ncbi:MAG: hypothetical protein M3Q65_14245 [Chloroflexota bacterium]|nr:hypothetical protein [Chloroflexota bacterium]